MRPVRPRTKGVPTLMGRFFYGALRPSCGASAARPRSIETDLLRIQAEIVRERRNGGEPAADSEPTPPAPLGSPGKSPVEVIAAIPRLIRRSIIDALR